MEIQEFRSQSAHPVTCDQEQDFIEQFDFGEREIYQPLPVLTRLVSNDRMGCLASELIPLLVTY